MSPPSASPSPGAFKNGIRPAHSVILMVFLMIRYAGMAWASGSGGGGDGQHGGGGEGAEAEGHGGGGGEGHGAGGGHGHEGYQVFHVEFERVQLPFIISLWIFVSSLAKIGKKRKGASISRTK